MHKDCDDKDPRLVFDLEFLQSLPEFVPVRLNMFNTYCDTTLGRIMEELNLPTDCHMQCL